MSSKSTTVFVDAMGGDFAPKVNVKGALLALAEAPNLRVVLVGHEEKIRPVLKKELENTKPEVATRLSIHHTSDFIEMGEHPASAVRQKKEASMNVAMRMAAETPHSAFLSAGNSGAALASAIMNMRRIEGVDRPAIAAPLPTTRGFLLLMDAGANIQCKPEYLVQWAIMGSGVHRTIFGSKGTVGTLSNGSEDSKGTDLTRETNALLKALQEKEIFPPNTYHGYIEGGRMFSGNVDVVICDGFTGNLVLKSLEGLAKTVVDLLKKELKGDWLAAIGAVFAWRALKGLKKRMDYAEIGAAPLIGVNGHAFISHGRSHDKAIKNGILRAAESAKTDLPKILREILAKAGPMVEAELKTREKKE